MTRLQKRWKGAETSEKRSRSHFSSRTVFELDAGPGELLVVDFPRPRSMAAPWDACRGDLLAIPSDCICSLSHKIMEDPVVAADGASYERQYIQAWLDRGHRTSPLTELPLPCTKLIANTALRNVIQDLQRRLPELKRQHELELKRRRQLEWQREEDLGALRVKVDQDGIKVTACGAEETTKLHEADRKRAEEKARKRQRGAEEWEEAVKKSSESTQTAAHLRSKASQAEIMAKSREDDAAIWRKYSTALDEEAIQAEELALHTRNLIKQWL